MSVTEFKRGVPTYKDKDNNEYGLLCETKEVCVTDNDGVSLEYKLQTLMQNVTTLMSELQSCAKASDLSNYFPNSGGTVNGNVEVKSADLVERKIAVENSVRRLTLELGTDGSGYLWDGTNKKAVITSTKSGANTFNGVSSGNLPLKGGTVNGALTVSVENFTDLPAVQRNTYGDSMIRFVNSSGALGRIGFNGTSRQVGAYLDDEGTNDKFMAFLHTGNSSKVVISETAPSDTSALWVW